MPEKWQKLRISESDTVPILLYKYSINPKGYTFNITDLTHIWTEKLSFKDILRRAEEENTVIDPTDDPEQYDVLLEKVGEALLLNSHHPETKSSGNSSITVKRNNIDSLQLSISMELPHPLRPLDWPMYLSRESERSVAEQLLIPLLKEEAFWESRQRLLFDLLKQKDSVLEKIFDNVETLGIDLGIVLPGVAALRGSRGSTALKRAAKSIKGVAPFNERQWLDEVNKEASSVSSLPGSGPGLAANIVLELIGEASIENSHQLEHIAPAPAKWWENLGIHVAVSNPPSRHKDQVKQTTATSSKEAANSGKEAGDYFEVILFFFFFFFCPPQFCYYCCHSTETHTILSARKHHHD